MLYKSRTESHEILIWNSLNIRMKLSTKDKQYFYNIIKGLEGELLFDSILDQLKCDCFILNDLLFKMNNTVFQIDSLLIMAEAIYLFEVKNYEGDYYIEKDRWYKSTNSEIANPINQMRRTETLFRQLLQSIGIHLPIYSYVVFINPQFTLYQAPRDEPFILPSQIEKYFKKVDCISENLTPKHHLLAQKLISLHLTESPFNSLPTYDYDQLQKGMICEKCASFSIYIAGKKWRCVCGEGLTGLIRLIPVVQQRKNTPFMV